MRTKKVIIIFGLIALSGCRFRGKQNVPPPPEVHSETNVEIKAAEENIAEEPQYSDAERELWSDVERLDDVFTALEEEEFEKRDENWKDDARYLVNSGFSGLGDVENDYRAYRIAERKVEIWNDRRNALDQKIPCFWGDEADFQNALNHYGPMELLSSIDQNNPHMEGQIDQIQEYASETMSLKIYKANLDPLKYIVMTIRITGPIGVEAFDRLFSMSQEEIAYHYGEMEPQEDGYYCLSPLYDDLAYLGLKYQDGKVIEILYLGYID